MIWILFFAVVGISFWCIEIFMPGIVFGIIGSVCLLVSVGMSYVIYGVQTGNLVFLGVLVTVAAAILFEITVLPKTRLARMMVSKGDLADSKSADSLEALMGCTGKALTPLRPAGTALIGEKRIDVMAESGLIEPEASIKVIRVEGNRVIVRNLES